MNINQLRYFIGVAEYQSFTKAASRYYITQTAITQQIRALESHLGVQLFDRNTRPVRLTPEGSVFLREAKAILERVEQAEHLLQFFEAPDDEKDYSLIGSFSPADAVGHCVYCNHCKPCPVGIDIGLVNKYYDLARNGDPMAAEHYHGLALHGEDCIQCGHCNQRCPFHVDQMARMREIADYFC